MRMGLAERAGSAPALLCVYSAQQLLPALAALFEYRQRLGLPPAAPALALVWCPPGLGATVVARRMETVRQLTGQLPWLEVRDISGPAALDFLRVRMPGRVARLEGWLGGRPAGQVLYAHDLTADFLAQAAMQARPSACRICFGDAWGVVYSNEHFEAETFPCRWLMLLRAPLALSLNLYSRAHRRLSRGRRPMGPQAVFAILPLDPGGDVLARVPLVRVQRTSALEALRALQRGVPATGYPPRADGTLVLLGSYAESRLCSQEQEVALYDNALRARLPRGSRLVLKPHPAARPAKLARIESVLTQAGFRVERLDEALDEYPVELVCHHWAPAAIVSFSYSSVSLTYLGYPRVVHALDETLIGNHFPKASQPWMLDSNALYVRQVAVARELALEDPGI